MEDRLIVMYRVPDVGFPKAHLLGNITKGKPYEVVGIYCKSKKIVDDVGKEVWVSNKVFKKYFKEVTK